jgi:hypothetical protein
MRKLLALLVVLAVSGCGADETAPKAQQPADQVTSASTPTLGVSSATSGVSTAEPTRPYLLKGRLHVDGEVLPGRYAGAIVRGETWVGWKHSDGRRTWGTGTTTHRLPAVNAVEIAPDGRFIATVSGGKHCEGVGLNIAHKKCAVSLLDTSGAQPPRRLVVARTLVLVGVSDQGVVVLTEGAALRWNELVWDAAGGASAVQPLVDSPPLREWAMQGWEPNGFGHAGFELHTGNVPGRWLGEIVDGEVRLRFLIPEYAEPGPGGAWVLATRWLVRHQRELKGAFEPTAPTLRVRALGKRGSLGSPVPLRAPTGWFFARATPSDEAVFWEDAGTFLARVVDSRQSGDRLARCDLPLATCVLVES